jgi:hypothetical protein
VRTRVAFGAGLAAILAVALGTDRATAYVTDGGVYPPLNPRIFLPPAAGEARPDPAFGTLVRRITDAPATPNAADAGMLPLINNEYSTVSPWSRDNAHLLLVHHSYFGLYDGEGRYLRDLPFDIHAGSEPRWSRATPSLLYYLGGNTLLSYDVATGARAVVRVFSEYAEVRGGGESDLSTDGDHLVLVGDGSEIFVYEIGADRKGPVLDTGAPGAFDSVQITPDNNVLVGWYARGEGPRQGVELYDRSRAFLRQVNPDVTRDGDGAEVAVLAGAAGPAPACLSAVVKVRLADGARTCLLPLSWRLALHVSAPDEGGWVFVSTHDAGDPDPETGWEPYTNEILMVRMDGGEVRRLAHHRSRPFNDYTWQPRVSASRDGTRLVFSSNYGLPEIAGLPAHYSDAWFIDVSKAVPAAAGAARFLAERREEDAPAVIYEGAWAALERPEFSGGTARFAAAGRATLAFHGTGAAWIGHRDPWSGIARVLVDGVPVAEVDTWAPEETGREVLHSVSGLAPGPHALTVEATGRAGPLSGGAWVWVDAFDVTMRHEQDAAAAVYSGDWFHNLFPRHSGGSAALSMQDGGRVDFAFTGTAVAWVGYRDEWSGIARVHLDGVLRAVVDTFASPAIEQAPIYALTGIPPGPHLLTIEATRSKSPFSLGGWVWVDGFEVLP